MLRGELSLILSHFYALIDGVHDYEIAIGIIAKGHARVRPMVTNTYPLKDINAAYATACDKSAGAIKVQLIT